MGAGGLIYLKKAMISYANEVLGSPGAHLLQDLLDFLCKRAPGHPQAHLLKSICDFLCKWAPKGPQEEITNDSQAHLLEEISDFIQMSTPRLIYFKKPVISYANELLGVHLLKKSYMSYANGLLGLPGLIHLKRNRGFLMQMSSWRSPGSFT